MTKKSFEHLGEAIHRMDDPIFHAACIKRDRDHLAQILRAAKIRVKENKEKNGGIYISA